MSERLSPAFGHQGGHGHGAPRGSSVSKDGIRVQQAVTGNISLTPCPTLMVSFARMIPSKSMQI